MEITSMASFVFMPKLDPEMDYGEILAWQKSEGDMIHNGETLLNFKTGGTIAAVNTVVDGVLLAILVRPGTKVPVNMPIAILGDYGEPVHPMMAEARERLGGLMLFDAITGATEKMKFEIPLDELHCVPPDKHPDLNTNKKKK